MEWVRRHWKLVLYVAIAAAYVADRVFGVEWPLDAGMLLFVVFGGGWVAMGRVWDARRRDPDAVPPGR